MCRAVTRVLSALLTSIGPLILTTLSLALALPVVGRAQEQEPGTSLQQAGPPSQEPAPAVQQPIPPSQEPSPSAQEPPAPAPSPAGLGELPRDLSPWGMFLNADPLVQTVL